MPADQLFRTLNLEVARIQLSYTTDRIGMLVLHGHNSRVPRHSCTHTSLVQFPITATAQQAGQRLHLKEDQGLVPTVIN